MVGTEPRGDVAVESWVKLELTLQESVRCDTGC